MTNFIDSSLLLVSVVKKGYLLNYVNDKFLQTFMDHFKNISFDESDEETEENESSCFSCLRKKDIKLTDDESQADISERITKLDRLFRKKIFREFDMESELFSDDRQQQGMQPW